MQYQSSKVLRITYIKFLIHQIDLIQLVHFLDYYGLYNYFDFLLWIVKDIS